MLQMLSFCHSVIRNIMDFGKYDKLQTTVKLFQKHHKIDYEISVHLVYRIFSPKKIGLQGSMCLKSSLP